MIARLPRIHLDFETRSVVDLRQTGVYRMVEDPHCSIWCAGWAVAGGPVQVWEREDPLPAQLIELVEAGAEIHAWNANFEHVVWNSVLVSQFGAPPVPVEQFHCTMVRGAAVTLPRSLEKAAEVLLEGVEKDKKGRALALRMAKPRSMEGDTPVWWNTPKKRADLAAYCAQDVEVERALWRKLPPLSPKERELWLLDQRANGRGVMVDVPVVVGAREVVDHATDELNERIWERSGNTITSVTNHDELRAWVNARGIETNTVAKAWLESTLAEPDLDPLVREVLQLRKDGARTSTAKLDKFLSMACADGRARGLLQFLAADTGRWGGRGIQPQNFPRGTVRVDRNLFGILASPLYDAAAKSEIIRLMYGPPVEVVSSALRGMLVAAPGRDLLAADFSQIEARVLAWLAGQDDVLEAFRGDGKVYELMASRVYGIPVGEVTKEMRQLGKVVVLGAGYQMGGPRFQSHAADYGVELTEEEAARVIGIFRETNDRIVAFWYACQDAAERAILRPGLEVRVGRVTYSMRGKFLTAELPSGRLLWYATPWLQEREGWSRPSIHYMGVDSYTKKWTTQTTYGGKLVENITQAVARDVMAEGLQALEHAGYPLLLTVHDEVILEPAEGHGSVEEVERIICDAPEWAQSLPVAAEGWRGKRYRK